MIRVQCECGMTISLGEDRTNKPMACVGCGRKMIFLSPEKLPDGAGLGDFDACLRIISGPSHVGETVYLGGCLGINIGKRDDNHLVLPGKLVSRCHCKLERVDFGPPRWNLLDNGSTNGLFVNGHRVTGAELQDGDSIRIGEYELDYHRAAEEPVAAAQPAYVASIAAGGVATAPTARSSGHSPGAVCPSCGMPRGVGVKVCTDCGIHIATGRPIIVSQGRNEDAVYANAETVIRLVSWPIPITPLPIPLASEAYGKGKPLTIWAIAASTILASLIFFIACSGGDRSSGMEDLMLWPRNPDLAKLADQVVQKEFPQISGELRDAARAGVMTELKKLIRPYHGYQLLTHAWLHDPSSIFNLAMHLGGNMLFLLVFGSRINALIGNIATMVAYPLLAVAAAATQLAFQPAGSIGPMLGASGAINGLAGMYLILFPVHRVYCAMWIRWGLIARFRLSYKIFAMRGFWVLLIYFAYDVAMIALEKRAGAEGGTAHWAHVGGFVTGVVLGLCVLMSRIINCHNGDLLSVTLGKYAWPVIGKPSRSATAQQAYAMARG